MLFVYRVDQNESVNYSFNEKPLIYLGFPVRARIIHKCRQIPVFSSGRAFKNLESQHGLPPPRQFLVDRTVFCWKEVLMKMSRCHSPSNTSQGEGSNNRSSPLTIIDPSYPVWYRHHPLDLVNNDQWLRWFVHLGRRDFYTSAFFTEQYPPHLSILLPFYWMTQMNRVSSKAMILVGSHACR